MEGSGSNDDVRPFLESTFPGKRKEKIQRSFGGNIFGMFKGYLEMCESGAEQVVRKKHGRRCTQRGSGQTLGFYRSE